ncbi:MAG: ComEA family DNA-binding protein [Myxococcota bacterium]|nr:ComEA family DNA-binding protein [Myxococcota bacterium]
MRNPAVFGPVLLLAACGGPDADESIQLSWNLGDTFHLAATYRSAEVMNEIPAVSLYGDEMPTFAESWSDEVIWTYSVVESGLIPDADSELYAFSLTAAGSMAPLTVIQASVDPMLNTDNDMLEADPVIYLVFREDRDRLAAIVSFRFDSEGERVEEAWSSSELGRSYSTLSQTQLTKAPALLAPFGAKWGDSERMLENGSYVTTFEMGRDSTDVVYEDEMGGDLITSRYEFGQPWPVFTASDNMEIRLMDSKEVEDARMPGFQLPTAPEDFDYRGALRTSIDLDSALHLDEETMAGGWSASVHEGYRPWAGNWWPLKTAKLVFGSYGGSCSSDCTYSEQLKEEVDEIKHRMDDVQAELRDMKDGDEGYDDKVEAYHLDQKALVELLVEFYDGIRDGLDGGKIIVEEGSISKAASETPADQEGEEEEPPEVDEGWSYKLDELSPMDKYALDLYFQNPGARNNPFYIQAWELLNSYNPGGESWWGHCNGWAAAAIMTNEPRESMTRDINGNEVEYTTADLKGLFSEAHYATYSQFYGSRYNGEEDDVSDISPKAFHKLVSFYHRELQVPMVFDTTATEEVWNFPAWSTEIDVKETTPEGLADRVNINTASVEELDALPLVGPARGTDIVEHREAHGPFQAVDDLEQVEGIGNETMEAVRELVTVDPFQRTWSMTARVKITTDGVGESWVDTDENAPKSSTKTYRYTLTTDAEGVVVDGKWEDDKNHPDFAWIPYSNPRGSSNGNSENPFMEWGKVLETVGEHYERR